MDERQTRCGWCGDDPLYVAYHDDEWGVIERNDRALFEMLLLEGFQAGLSWITVLRKRENFRKAFDGFEPSKMVTYDEIKVSSLMNDQGIIRHRGKVEGAIHSARATLDIIEKAGSFSKYLWQFVDGKPIINHFRTMSEVPTQTPSSAAMSKTLKQQGFKFCGPTICYAFMQAAGMVNDHLVDCFRHPTCR